MLTIKNLQKSYPLGKETLPVLKGIQLTVEKGEFVAILGPSGCGKSTLLNIIGGLDKYDGGDMLFEGKSTKDFSEKEWNKWRKEKIGFVFQNFNLIPQLSALGNVEMSMKMRGFRKRERRKRAKQLLEIVGLKDRMNHKPNQLSGGQKQRVAIARAIANYPKILLADEPTGAVDSKTSAEIMELLKKLNKKYGVTILMVTHDKELAAQTERIVSILDGEIIGDRKINDNCHELYEREDCFITENDFHKPLSNMSIATAISIGLYNLFHKAKRTVLTVLGASIGIAGVVFMLGICNGAESKVYQELGAVAGNSGINVIAEDKNILLDSATKKEIEAVQGVEDVVDKYSFTGAVVYENTKVAAYVQNLAPAGNRLKDEEDKLDSGEFPQTDSEEGIVIGVGTAKKLAGEAESIIGKHITVFLSYDMEDGISDIVQKDYVVTGLSKENIFGVETTYIPLNTAEEVARESVGTEMVYPQRLCIYTADKEDEEMVRAEVEKIGLSTVTTEDGLSTVKLWFQRIKGFLMLIAGISLIVSSVMIIVVLTMSVVERTKEIGILRAIGAGRVQVAMIFLAEAGIIGLFAGIIGSITAGILGEGINQGIAMALPKYAFPVYIVNDLSILCAIIFSILICLLAGYLPARKASKMDTILALGHK